MPQSLSVSRGGVRIHKSVLGEEGPLCLIAFVVESEREVPVSVRVREEIPEDVPRSAVGLHEDYEADSWRVTEDGHLEYGRELPPGETAVAGFFVRGGEELARHFFVTPSIEDVRQADGAALST